MDSRLAYGDLTNKTLPQRQNVDSGIMGQIWTPDLFFANEKNARKHTLLKENVFVEIASDGQVMISQRLTLVSHCFMDFSMFPFDSQLCQISIESYDEGYKL